MAVTTWIDSGAEVAESLRHWITGLASAGSASDFSPQQLEFLQELLKAGMIGMAKVIADRLAKLEDTIAQCEAVTSTESDSEKVAVNVGSSKTKSRRHRRRKAKSKHMDAVRSEQWFPATCVPLCVHGQRRVISLWDELYGIQPEVIEVGLGAKGAAECDVWEFVSDSDETMEMTTLRSSNGESLTCVEHEDERSSREPSSACDFGVKLICHGSALAIGNVSGSTDRSSLMCRFKHRFSLRRKQHCAESRNSNSIFWDKSRLACSFSNDMLSKPLALVRSVEPSREQVPNRKFTFNSDEDTLQALVLNRALAFSFALWLNNHTLQLPDYAGQLTACPLSESHLAH